MINIFYCRYFCRPIDTQWATRQHNRRETSQVIPRCVDSIPHVINRFIFMCQTRPDHKPLPISITPVPLVDVVRSSNIFIHLSISIFEYLSAAIPLCRLVWEKEWVGKNGKEGRSRSVPCSYSHFLPLDSTSIERHHAATITSSGWIRCRWRAIINH